MRFLSFTFALLYCNLSFALGLGDIELRSHLNAPLKASIALSDAEPVPDASCFTATDNSEVTAFKKAYVTLKKVNGAPQLNIISYDVITEPIVNLLLTFHCDPKINREYVLLMDPAPISSPEVATTSTEKPVAADQGVPTPPKAKKKIAKAKPEIVADAAAPDTDAVPEKPIKKKRKKVVTPAATVDQKLAEAYTGKPATESQATPQTQGAPKPEVKPGTDKPYLVISGGNTDASGNQPLSLRLETQIDFARTETAPAPTNSAEEADEVTVMTNRLAHLEKQILSLQAKNTQLQAENEKVKNESFRVSPVVYEWLQRILIGLGVIAALAIAELLRRKIMRKRSQQDEAVWFDAEANDEPQDEELPNAKNISASIFNEPSFNEPNLGTNFSVADQKNAFSSQSNLAGVESEEVENVLDHADVFIEHGRPALAIQLLQTHLEEAPAESPAIWMKLLNLLAKEGAEADYETAVKECNQFFNIKMPNFTEAMNEDHSTIEEHPHIITRLEGVWGSHYAVGFLNDLIYNQQSQPREGFERGTFEELFFLKQIASILESADPATTPTQAYKPEVVKPVLASAMANLTTLDDSGTADTDADVNTLEFERTTQFSQTPIDQAPSQLSVASEVVDAAANADVEFTETNMDSIDEGATKASLNAPAFDQPDYEVDMLLDIEETPAESSAKPTTLDFEDIDFSVSADEPEIVTSEVLPGIEVFEEELESPDTSANKQATESVIEVEEESEADLISKYLAQAEEKAKNKKPDDDSNVIEFDWDLPKVDKD